MKTEPQPSAVNLAEYSSTRFSFSFGAKAPDGDSGNETGDPRAPPGPARE